MSINIGERIVQWYKQNGRKLPWRETTEPYDIWISEIILQQTRIAQGTSYYIRFIERFPNVHMLADASLEEVLKYWEGLGYYSRAKNLHSTAIYLSKERKGVFPNHYTELIKLKGIGEYTSRAIGSFAFGNQAGVIDGNVLRVMSRFLGDSSPINEPKTRKRFQVIIDEWVKGVKSSPFNHGIMDIGSVVCTPTKPGCLLCPLQKGCVAYKKGWTTRLPVKKKKLKRKVRYFNFYLIHNDKREVAIRRRPLKGFWGGLWEVPNEEISQSVWKRKDIPKEGTYKGHIKHVFTHFDMMIHVYTASAESFSEESEILRDIQFIPTEKIPTFAFSKGVWKVFDMCKVGKE